MQPTISGFLAFLLGSEGASGYTFRHSVQVAGIAATLGKALQLDTKLIEAIRIGSLLHDVGKMSIPNEILLKSGCLSDAEIEQIHQHPLQGHLTVGALDLAATERQIILFHHERWDGTGYPYGFAGEDIPLAARVVSLADAIDAMLTDRPYRPALSLKSVHAEVVEQSGAQFDPAIAKIAEKYLFKIVKQYKNF